MALEGAMDLPRLAARVAQELSSAHRLAYAEVSPALQISYFSDNLDRLLGSNPAAGQPLTEILWEFVGAESALEDILRGDRAEYRLERINRSGPDGAARYLDFRVIPLKAAAPSDGLVLIVEDRTRSGQLEQRLVQDRNELRLTRAELARTNTELERLNRLKSLFLSIVAHDLRAPLTAILGYAELVQSGLPEDSSPEHAEFLEIIASQIRWMNRMANDLVDLEQIERGQLSVRLEECDLAAIGREVAAVFADATRRQRQSLRLDLPAEPVLVRADAERVRQIIFNLLGNAIKYTDAGGAISLAVAAEAGNGVLRIADNGRGMTPEEQSQLFQLYYRSDLARESALPGAGIGLYVVNTLVDAHGGQIEVDSEPERGTRFTVRLPGGGNPDDGD